MEDPVTIAGLAIAHLSLSPLGPEALRGLGVVALIGSPVVFAALASLGLAPGWPGLPVGLGLLVVCLAAAQASSASTLQRRSSPGRSTRSASWSTDSAV
ncbi:MAG: hypothetical protein H6739_11255 [Alphaproteobacteria bacterium]|nr:hypothetical protein [Alphaproteobacteria bacterium]